MVEKSISLFEITDRRIHKAHIASQVFNEDEVPDLWIKRLRMMFPVEEYEEMINIFKSEDVEVTAFKVQVEYKRIGEEDAA
jgi:hypothetical protein